ncbi:unnamed protein product [Rotaria sp. Silwood2]|nr:unnamed protein product [Rotaria sp. Silwood2]
MSYTILNRNARKYDDRTLSDLLRTGLLDAADVEIDIEKCIEPLLSEWLTNYDYDTSAQPIGIFFTLLTVLAHVTHNVTILQWNKIRKHLNLYSFILGISGACKSGFIRPVRAAYTALIDFLRQYHLGDPDSYNSLVDTFTTAGLYDQLVQSTNVLVLQEEIDTTLHNMGFYVTSGNDGRQLLCSLWEGLDDNKKTKSYRQNVRQSHLTLCGASTGKSFIPLIRECLDNLPTDGVIDRCLILVVPYSRFTRDLLKPRDLRKPTISQILLCASLLGQRQLIFDDDAYNAINTYTDDLTHRAAISYRTSPRFTSYLAKQPPQVIKLCGLMTVVHVIVNILSRLNLHLFDESDHGLSLAFYNEVQIMIQQRVPYAIIVTRNIVDRAIYLHGFLYEQSERLLHLNTHQSNNVPQIKLTGSQLQKHLMREILMMRNLIVMTNAIFSIPGISHVHRSLVKNALQQLVAERLLLADYFVLTSTNRPIFCYIKTVPKVNDVADREMMIQKLQQYDIALEEFVILNSTYTLAKGNRLHQQALEILSTPSYVAICGGPYEQQLDLAESLPVRNLQRNVSYSSNMTTEPHVQQRQPASFLFNRQHSQRISTTNNRPKRSFSPHIIESNESVHNSQTTNEVSHRNSQEHRLAHTRSTTPTSSQETIEPRSPTIHNTADAVINQNRVQNHITASDNLLSSTSHNRKFFKTTVRRTLSIPTHSSYDATRNTRKNSRLALENQLRQESVENIQNLPINASDNSSTPQIQRLIDEYFPHEPSPYEEINNLNENTTNFQIRCKTIHKSPIRYFGTSSKVFDAIVCDFTGEIKAVAFNEDVDRLYNSMTVNQTIIIQSDKIQKTNENYRTPYSVYEIRLTSASLIEPYVNHNFKPNMRITKQQLFEIPQKIHGSSVDTEGIVIMDRGILTTVSETTGANLRRRIIKIKDQTSAINVTIWNDKNNNLPENMMNKTIRIRNGKINHYNGRNSYFRYMDTLSNSLLIDYVSINVSEQTIIELYE